MVDAKGAGEQELDYYSPIESDNSFNDIPYIGKVADIKHNDPPHKQPRLCFKIHSKQFQTTVPRHMKEYIRIQQAVADEKATIFFEEKHYNEKIKGWHILINWGDFYYASPIKETKGK
mgnify:CR=1 FL=1